MKKTKTSAAGLGISALLLLCACGHAEEADSRPSEVTTVSETAAISSNTNETTEAAESATEMPSAAASTDIAFIYAENWGVVHNVWELSYNADREPSYLYEYRRSGTPHTEVIRSCPVSREEGDKVFALFLEKDIIHAPDTKEDETGEMAICGGGASSISFGYVGDDTVYHRYPSSEDFSAIMDSILALEESTKSSTAETRTK